MAEQKKYFSAPKEVNTVFGDETHEFKEPDGVTSEELQKELKEADDFDD